MKYYKQPTEPQEFIPIDPSTIVKKVDFSDRAGFNAAIREEMAIINEGEQALREIDRLARQTESILYRVIIIPRGDCVARYQITKINKTTCHVKHIDLGDDAWAAPQFGGGGNFTIKYVGAILTAFPN